MLLLVEPNTNFEKSYKNLIEEFEGEELVPFTLGYDYEDFPSLVERLTNNSIGIDLPKGFVANSSYWLISGDQIIGVSNLRHELTDKLKIIGGHIGFGIRPSMRSKGYGNEILRLTFGEALKKGISKVLVTCNKNNIASAKIIVKNGGIFESEEYLEEHNGTIQRYWIRYG